MSVILLSAKHINLISANLTYLVNPMSYLHNFDASDELRREIKEALKPCYIKGISEYSYDEVYTELVKLNLAAYNECYAKNHGEATAENVGTPSEKAPILWRAFLNHRSERAGIPSEYYSFAKLLTSFIYQCDEHCNKNSALLNALKKLLLEYECWLLEETADYDKAPWTI